MPMPDNEIALKYLLSLLSPDQQNELGQLLGENQKVSAAEPDDLAQDALRGRIAMDRLPERIRRVAMARVAPRSSADEDARFHKLFPDSGRLR